MFFFRRSTAIVSLKAPGSRQILQEAAPRWTDASTAPGSRVHDCNLLGVGDPKCRQDRYSINVEYFAVFSTDQGLSIRSL